MDVTTVQAPAGRGTVHADVGVKGGDPSTGWRLVRDRISWYLVPSPRKVAWELLSALYHCSGVAVLEIGNCQVIHGLSPMNHSSQKVSIRDKLAGDRKKEAL